MNMLRNLVLVGLMTLLSTATHAATIALHSNSINIAVGQEFVIDVVLQDPFAGEFSSDVLLAFGFDLDYDNSAFSLTSKTVGPGWDDDSPFLDVDMAGSTFPGIEDDGSGTSILLAQLSFIASSAGNFILGIAGNPLDNANLGLIYLGGEVPISAQAAFPVQPVPLPAAGWLLASGLLALFRVRRCR